MGTLPQPPSFDEHLTSLESVPLFMSSLPDDPADNVALSALQSLVHDGTPDGTVRVLLSIAQAVLTNTHTKRGCA
jgi:hypothetical protein